MPSACAPHWTGKSVGCLQSLGCFTCCGCLYSGIPCSSWVPCQGQRNSTGDSAKPSTFASITIWCIPVWTGKVDSAMNRLKSFIVSLVFIKYFHLHLLYVLREWYISFPGLHNLLIVYYLPAMVYLSWSFHHRRPFQPTTIRLAEYLMDC